MDSPPGSTTTISATAELLLAHLNSSLHNSLYMFWMMVTIFLITWLSGARFSHLITQRHQKNATIVNSYGIKPTLGIISLYWVLICLLLHFL